MNLFPLQCQNLWKKKISSEKVGLVRDSRDQQFHLTHGIVNSYREIQLSLKRLLSLFNVKNNCSKTISFWLSYYILDTNSAQIVCTWQFSHFWWHMLISWLYIVRCSPEMPESESKWVTEMEWLECARISVCNTDRTINDWYFGWRGK